MHGKKNLGVPRCRFDHGGKFLHGRRRQSQFRFVDGDEAGQKFRRLQQDGCQGHETQGAVRYLVRIKKEIVPGRVFPVQSDIVRGAGDGVQDEIAELGHDPLNVTDNAIVIFFAGGVISQHLQKSSQISAIVTQRACVIHIDAIFYSGGFRCVIEMIDRYV